MAFKAVKERSDIMHSMTWYPYNCAHTTVLKERLAAGFLCANHVGVPSQF